MNNINQYEKLKEKHSEELEKFPIKFAFSDEQFKKAMEELGLTENDDDKIVAVSNTGGFIRKTDVKSFNEMVSRHRKEEKEAMMNDLTGEGYIKDMFEYELANHEYGYTYDLEDTLNAIGLSMEEINNDKRLKHGLDLALNSYRENNEEEDER